MTKVSPQVLGLTKTTDTNGWNVYDYGAFKIYKKRVTFSQNIGGAAALAISSSNLPVGVSNLSLHYLDYSYTATGSAYALGIVYEGSTSTTSIGFTTARNDNASAATFTGFIDVTITS